uniref:DUF7289 family protein n=1 Tax=Salinarchaeum laminariae TaxID=869888 RepID=UPI0020BEAC68|nr:hypothetical protein [Salinarchaeum laminariae]
MIFIGAAAVLVAGGALVDDVQGSSQHELAVDSAVQTHQAISEALQSGEARQLAVSDGVDMEIVESGSISIAMHNGSDVCSTGPVEAKMGAIVYDTPKGSVVYQGGGIWEKTDGGLSIQRSPPISYDNETARISIQTVTADSDSFDGQMAMPNETMQETMVEETNELLTNCPANGYTDLNISVTSPNYAEVWKDHFNSQITGTNVKINDTHDEMVHATISNATTAHESRGLRFANISAPSIVDPASGDYSNEFYLSTEIANDGFDTEEATVRLEIHDIGAANHSNTPGINPGETVGLNFTTGANNFSPSTFTYNGLVNAHNLTTDRVYGYTVRLYDGDGERVSESSGDFFLAGSDSMGLYLADAEDTFLDADQTQLAVNGTLINTGTSSEEADLTFEITEENVDMDPMLAKDVNVSAYGGMSEVGFQVNVSALRAGTYEYKLSSDEVTEGPETKYGEFTITERDEGTLVDLIRVESVTPTQQYLEYGEDSFSVDVGVHNVGNSSTSGTLALNISGLPTVTKPITLSKGENTSKGITVPSENVSTLPPGETHNYEVQLVENDEEFIANGSFYLGKSGEVPVIESVSNATDPDDWVTINSTVSNHGLNDIGDEPVNLTLHDQDGTLVGSDNVTVDVPAGATPNATFGFNASNLVGVYNYTIEFGGETVTRTLKFEGSVQGGNGSVSVNAPGNGTLTVLGTEISGESVSSPWWKEWAPVGAAAVMERNGQTQRFEYTNGERTTVDLVNDQNLNTYDTQNDIYEWGWSQDAGETVSVTLNATYWTREDTGGIWGGCSEPYDSGEDHTRNGPGYDEQRTYTDYHPDPIYYQDETTTTWWGTEVTTCDSYAYSVDASQGSNPSNVEVLTDGDTVPGVQRAYPDQRNVSQILNDGASDRLNSDNELQLNDNEMVFLVELTDQNANFSKAVNTSGGADYNDVIALLEFTPANPDQNVSFTVGDDDAVSITLETPSTVSGEGPQYINDTDSSIDEENGATPTPANPESPAPGDPSGPEEIDVDVGGIVIG